MLIPSYAELMDVLNEDNESDEVTSRYTIVIAAAKRARQIIEGDEPMVKNKPGKPVSTAVDEMLNKKIKIVPEGEGTVLVFNKKEETVEQTIEKMKEKIKEIKETEETQVQEEIEEIEEIDLDIEEFEE